MAYLIDGHNLIPKVGLRLDSVDDETELIAMLQEFCRLKRRPLEVYFDGAPAPHAGTRKVGLVIAHFVPRGTTADEAIRKRLKSMGKSAKNWTVVSSDRQVQAEARAVHAAVLSSEEFSRLLQQSLSVAPKTTTERTLSQQEVEEWLRMFRQAKKR
jgi:predicted RNA-binding protein with PIN domain